MQNKLNHSEDLLVDKKLQIHDFNNSISKKFVRQKRRRNFSAEQFSGNTQPFTTV